MQILMVPTASRILYGALFVFEYALFFFPLYRTCRHTHPIRSALCCFTIYMLSLGVTTRVNPFLVMLLHVLLAFLSACQLHSETGIQRQYALFLSLSFILCRGVWNSSVFSTLFPVINGFPAHLKSLLIVFITLLTLYIMRRYVIRLNTYRRLAARELFVELFPAYAAFFARIVLYHYSAELNHMLTPDARQAFSILGVLLTFSTLISLSANELYFSYSDSKRQLDLAQAQLKRQYEMFTERQRSDEQLKRVYHDMANHLNVLRSLRSTEEIRRYIGSIDEMTRSALEENDTGNETLNLLLRQKSEECRKVGLTLEAAVRFPQADLLTPMEICTLFSNCIDNAIEAASHESVSDKTIRISGYEQHGCLIVRFENAYAHSLKYEEKHLVTSKSGPLHGYGLKNVRDVLSKHDGALSIHPQDGRFVLTFMLPVDQLSPENAQLS